MAFKALMAFFGSIANLSAGGPCYLHLDARDAASIFEEINRPACRKLVVMLKLLVLRIGNKEKKKKKSVTEIFVFTTSELFRTFQRTRQIFGNQPTFELIEYATASLRRIRLANFFVVVGNRSRG